MQSDYTAHVKRRSLLASLGGIAGASMVIATQARADDEADSDARPRKLAEVQKEFERLLPLWQEERKQFANSSKTYAYWKGPCGKAIIALGPAIIPYLIRQVKEGDFFFNVPLALITKVDMAGGSEQANSKMWVKWWEAAENSPNE